MGHRIMGQVWTLAANNRFLAQEKTLQNDRILGGGDARIGLGFLMQDWRGITADCDVLATRRVGGFPDRR
jgi:hypothetical protein